MNENREMLKTLQAINHSLNKLNATLAAFGKTMAKTSTGIGESLAKMEKNGSRNSSVCSDSGGAEPDDHNGVGNSDGEHTNN